MSLCPRELALFKAIESNLAALGHNHHASAACELTVILHEQCSAYHLALAQIAAIARQGGITERDIFNVIDNLNQPL